MSLTHEDHKKMALSLGAVMKKAETIEDRILLTDFMNVYCDYVQKMVDPDFDAQSFKMLVDSVRLGITSKRAKPLTEGN